MTVQIVSADLVFARMLTLSFAERGVNAALCAPEAAFSQPYPDLILADAGCFADVVSHLPFGVSVILFGTEEDVRALPESVLRTYFILERPFCMEELWSVLFAGEKPTKEKSRTGEYGIVLDAASRRCYVCGEQILLSGREYALFSLLVKNRGRVVTREEAFSLFLGDEKEQKSNVVDVYIKYLREKIDEHFDIKLIRTVRGVGYTIE